MQRDIQIGAAVVAVAAGAYLLLGTGGSGDEKEKYDHKLDTHCAPLNSDGTEIDMSSGGMIAGAGNIGNTFSKLDAALDAKKCVKKLKESVATINGMIAQEKALVKAYNSTRAKMQAEIETNRSAYDAQLSGLAAGQRAALLRQKAISLDVDNSTSSRIASAQKAIDEFEAAKRKVISDRNIRQRQQQAAYDKILHSKDNWHSSAYLTAKRAYDTAQAALDANNSIINGENSALGEMMDAMKSHAELQRERDAATVSYNAVWDVDSPLKQKHQADEEVVKRAAASYKKTMASQEMQQRQMEESNLIVLEANANRAQQAIAEAKNIRAVADAPLTQLEVTQTARYNTQKAKFDAASKEEIAKFKAYDSQQRKILDDLANAISNQEHNLEHKDE